MLPWQSISNNGIVFPVLGAYANATYFHKMLYKYMCTLYTQWWYCHIHTYTELYRFCVSVELRHVDKLVFVSQTKHSYDCIYFAVWQCLQFIGFTECADACTHTHTHTHMWQIGDLQYQFVYCLLRQHKSNTWRTPKAIILPTTSTTQNITASCHKPDVIWLMLN